MSESHSNGRESTLQMAGSLPPGPIPRRVRVQKKVSPRAVPCMPSRSTVSVQSFSLTKLCFKYGFPTMPMFFEKKKRSYNARKHRAVRPPEQSVRLYFYFRAKDPADRSMPMMGTNIFFPESPPNRLSSLRPLNHTPHHH